MLLLFGYACCGVVYWYAKSIALMISEIYPDKHITVIFDSLSILLALRIFGARRFISIDRIKSYLLGSTLNSKLWMRAHSVTMIISLGLLVWAVIPPGLYNTKAADISGSEPIILLYLKLLGVVFALCQLRVDIKAVYGLSMNSDGAAKDVPYLEPLKLTDLPGKDLTLICHFTDLHLTRTKGNLKPNGVPPRVDDIRTMSGEGGNIWNRFRETLETGLEHLESAHCLLVTGDVTDTGAPEEWRLFFQAFKGFEWMMEKMVLVPGNHDVNVFHALPLYLSDGDDAPQRKLNLIRVLYGINLFQGRRAYIISDGQMVLFSDWFAKYSADLNRFYAGVPRRVYMTIASSDGTTSRVDVTPPEVEALISLPDQVFFEAFPMLVEVPNCEVIFLLLDSNLPNSNVVTNAFGYLNERQVLLAKELLEEIAEQKYPVVIAAHHHIGNPPDDLMPRGKQVFQDRGLTLANPMDLLGALPRQREYILFNGHRHLRYSGKTGNLTVISGPSTTLGDSAKKVAERRSGFGLYGLDWDSNGSLSQIYERWIGV
jgi:hypothetical protein